MCCVGKIPVQMRHALQLIGQGREFQLDKPKRDWSITCAFASIIPQRTFIN